MIILRRELQRIKSNSHQSKMQGVEAEQATSISQRRATPYTIHESTKNTPVKKSFHRHCKTKSCKKFQAFSHTKHITNAHSNNKKSSHNVDMKIDIFSLMRLGMKE
jgi:hypothetical protein